MRAALIACGLFWTASTAPATPVSAAEATPPQVIKLERFRKALWTVSVTVNGKTGRFFLDTGGGRTLLETEFAKGVDCRFWGRTTGFNMFGEPGSGPRCDQAAIASGQVALTSADVGVIDWGDRWGADRKPDGLLSLDAFDGKVITLDQAAATLTLETDESLARRVATATEVPLRLARECSGACLTVFMGVPTKAGMAWLTLDSGAGGVSLIAKDYAELFGLRPERQEQRLVYEVAPGIVADSPVVVADMIMDGNLGQPFLSRHVVTLDLAHARAWIASSNGARRP
ncbi:aspartyl protease family protein [Caulobacter segnis]|uniref:aspartyl protease family protein n=1 Tax=Caulobacter segnis TaxID=88688 RepID=UPI00240F0D1E|nr:aspartyl protease family protein [Caulobacter segnis]MDG2520655.1 aspartyl protease family protein [Caulobacter segnis]